MPARSASISRAVAGHDNAVDDQRVARVQAIARVMHDRMQLLIVDGANAHDIAGIGQLTNVGRHACRPIGEFATGDLPAVKANPASSMRCAHPYHRGR
jgi:hypothetical protein